MASPNDAKAGATSRRQLLRWVTAATTSVLLCTTHVSSVWAEDDQTAPLAGRLFTYNPKRGGQADGLGGGGVLDLKTGTWSRISENINSLSRVSPNGSFVASPLPGLASDSKSRGVYVLDLDGERLPTRLADGNVVARGWSSDGRWLLAVDANHKSGDAVAPETWRLNVDGKTRERLPLKETDWPDDWSPDGRRVLVTNRAERGPNTDGGIYVPPVEIVGIDGTGRNRIVEAAKAGNRISIVAGRTPRFTPDGQRVIYGVQSAKGLSASIWSVNIDGKDRKCLVPEGPDEYPDSFCVSPDGRHLAVVFVTEERGEVGQPVIQSRELSIVAIDGTHRRRLPLPLDNFYVLDWRTAPQ